MTETTAPIHGESPPDDPQAAFKDELARIASKATVAAGTVLPAKAKRGGHKKAKGAFVGHDVSRETIAGESTPDGDAALDKFTAAMAKHQSFVGLVPTIPPREPPQPKVGRSTRYEDYTEEQLTTLLQLTAEGYALNRIGMRDDMPFPVTIRLWCIENPSFYSRYARARDLGLIARADQGRDEIATSPDPVRAKLLFEHDKWYLAKMMPKTYGERSELHTTQTIEHKHTIDVTQLTPDALVALEGVLIEAKAIEHKP